MWLTSLAIKRPLIALIGIGALLAFGLVAWTRLGVELLPTIDIPYVTVTTLYPGAGPDAVDTLITTRVEDAVASLNDIDTIQATSVDGVSNVSILFTDRASKNSAQDVERRVNAIRADLPSDAKAPTIDKQDPNAQPVLGLALGGDNRSLTELQQLAEDKVQKDLEAINGVARVKIVGGLERQVQVQVDQRKLEARGLSILQVMQALEADNLNVPAGNVVERNQDWTIRFNSKAQALADLQTIPVTPDGAVRIRDVALVVDTHKEVAQAQRANGAPSVGMLVYKQASANTVAVSAAVNQALPGVRNDLPAGVSLDTQFDTAPYITSSVADIQHELLLAILLTGLVLLVFLHTFRSTAIVLLAIPTSLVSTFGVMLLLGITFNFMSLMALALTVGILVDDSIVVLENIARHLKLGEAPRQAAINGRSEIGTAAIAITLVDVVVYTPIALMSGIVGQYFREFGLVITIATLFSLLVSFTLTPLLASRWYRSGISGGAGHAAGSRHPLALFARAWDAGYARLASAYERVLGTSLRFRWIVVALAIASFVGGVSLPALGLLSTEAFPADDIGQVELTVEMPAGTPLASTSAATSQVEARLMAVPDVDKVFTTVGSSGSFDGTSQAHFADILVLLKDKRHRSRTSDELASEFRAFGTGIPGMTLKSGALSTFGAGSNSGAVKIQIKGEDQAVLASLAHQVAEVVRSTRGTIDVSDGGVVGQPELVVNIDRERAADLGLTSSQVAGVLRSGIAGSTVGTFRPDGTKGWDVEVILNPEHRARVQQVSDIPVLTPSGQTVRLGQVAHVATVSGPTRVDRLDRKRAVTVSANLDGRTSGDVAAELTPKLAALKLPTGYTISQDGAARSQADSFGQIFMALGVSVVLMYGLMAVLFESLLFPFIIMLSLPLAVVGAFGLLALTGNTLNLMSMIGMIMLTGLVGKNAILLIDFTNHLRQQGVARDAALRQAGPTRLRPILMTSAALILAMLPLAARLGDGGEWRAPLAVTVIGGLLTSTFLTLLVIPSVYTIVDDVQRILASLPRRIRRLAGQHPSGAGRTAPLNAGGHVAGAAAD
jgi:hydrophobic/amphiphilic exporter-1 (mainly G- bacteria), HAE1 family